MSRRDAASADRPGWPAELVGRWVSQKGRLALLVLVAASVSSCGASPVPRRSSASGLAPTVPTTALGTVAGSAATVPIPPTAAPALSSSTAPPVSTTACRPGDPLANVYHPYRLQVRSDCMTVTGTVAYVRSEDDGDVHINLALPASESHLLDGANYTYENGDLVAEIVPADQPGCTPGQPPPLPPTAYRSSSYDYGTCTGADIATPPQGSQVRISGPYVLDSDHGWMEIHPVWSVTVLGVGTSAPAASASSPPASDTEPAQPGAGGSAAWCQASAAPSNDGYTGDYQVSVDSNQPDTRATASDAGDTWSGYTNSSGYADIRLYHTSPGMKITVTVGAVSCSATA
ncbi:MAG: hypothetical protein ACYCTI_01690 [Acidimicrobiales bacterium]